MANRMEAVRLSLDWFQRYLDGIPR
jgi:hypothetical protein